MLGSDAVKRVNRGLGFRPDGNTLETHIVACFQEAQDDLEMGKTLPKFLLQESQPLTLLANTHTITLPSGFARASDEETMHYLPTGSQIPKFLLQKRVYEDAVKAYQGSDFATTGLKVYVIRNSTIDFVISPSSTTNLTWSYYKYADAFAVGSENQWLAHKSAKWWLIGECGYRIAKDLRDDRAVQVFDQLRSQGRAATFGDLLALEDATGPLVMGGIL